MAPKFITYEPTNPTPIPPSADASFKPENFRKVIEIGL